MSTWHAVKILAYCSEPALTRWHVAVGKRQLFRNSNKQTCAPVHCQLTSAVCLQFNLATLYGTAEQSEWTPEHYAGMWRLTACWTSLYTRCIPAAAEILLSFSHESVNATQSSSASSQRCWMRLRSGLCAGLSRFSTPNRDKKKKKKKSLRNPALCTGACQCQMSKNDWTFVIHCVELSARIIPNVPNNLRIHKIRSFYSSDRLFL